ncbi:MAG: toll/interleukin-1 receptor domain-containing protein [Bryobacteraceae bacterium]
MGVEFVAETKLKVFIAYVDEESEKALKLYDAFTAAGLDPWLDKRKLLPGQNWPRCIEQAITISDFFVPCFSRLTLRKRSHFHYEVRHALDCTRRMPLDDVFIMPVRLDACVLPKRIAGHIQYVDMFPDWDEGFEKILSSIAAEARLRAKRRSEILF